MDLTGRTFPGLLIEEPYHRETLGTVYRGRLIGEGMPVAVKVFGSEGGANSGEAEDRFLLEVQSLIRLRQSNLVRVLDSRNESGVRLLIMERVEATTLEDLLAEGKPLPISTAVAITDQILQALQALHETELVLGDLRPSNILIEPGDLVRVAGFGPSKSYSEVVTSQVAEPCWAAGRLIYLPPERLNNSSVCRRQGDLYALGIILYRMLTGRLPFLSTDCQGFADEKIQGKFAPPSDFNNSIPLKLDWFVNGLLSSDPFKRFDVGDARNRLGKIVIPWEMTTEQATAEAIAKIVPPAWKEFQSFEAVGLKDQKNGFEEMWSDFKEKKRSTPVQDEPIRIHHVITALLLVGIGLGLHKLNPFGKEPVLPPRVASKNDTVATIHYGPPDLQLPDELDRSSDKFEDLCVLGKLNAAESKTRKLMRDIRSRSNAYRASDIEEASQQVRIFISVGALDRASKYCDEVSKAAMQAFGPEDRRYAFCLASQGELQLAARDLTRAESTLTAAATLFRAQIEKDDSTKQDHLDYAQILVDLATLHEAMGDYPRAAATLDDSLATLRDHVEKSNLQFLAISNRLADFYRTLRQFAKAETLLNDACTATRKATTVAFEEFQTQQMAPAPLLPEEKGELAMLAYDRMTRMQNGTLRPGSVVGRPTGRLTGPNGLPISPEEHIRQQINDLRYDDVVGRPRGRPTGPGGVLISAEEYAKQQENDRRYNELVAKSARARDPELWRKEYDAARRDGTRQRLERELVVQIVKGRKTLPPPLVALLSHLATLNRLAELRLAKGDLAAAEAALTEAQAQIDGLQLGDAPIPESRVVQWTWGRLSALKGDLSKARNFFGKAVAGVDERDPLFAAVTSSWAMLNLMEGDRPAAVDRLRQVMDNDLNLVEATLPDLPEVAALNLVEANLKVPHALLQAMRTSRGLDDLAAYEILWRTRSLATRAITDQRRWVGDDERSLSLFEKRSKVGQALAALAHSGSDNSNRDERRKRVRELSEEKELLEKELATISRPLRRVKDLQSTRIADLMAVLPAGLAVVDLVQTRQVQPLDELAGNSRPTFAYDAFVIRGGGPKTNDAVTWVELGPSGPIDAAIAEWRADLLPRGEAGPRFTRGPDAADRRLRSLIWEKIEPHLTDCRTVIVIPDQAMTRLPWSALPGKEPGSVLLDQYAIATAPHGQGVLELLTRNEGPTIDPRLLLLGGADYNRSSIGDKARPTVLATSESRGRAATRDTRPGGRWPVLPGTVGEIEELRTLWAEAGPITLLTGGDANEQRLRDELPRSRFIHLATHGFFADPKYRSALQYDLMAEHQFDSADVARQGAWRRSTIAGRNPLILSGVVLAGANQPTRVDGLGMPTGDDGILTAEEVAYLDLSNADLVVLSACQTGLGDVAGGEGVFGLQRAFHLAGARTTVASLWQVDDQATRALMVEFYRNLWDRKLGRLDALRQAQLAMLARYDPRSSRLARGKEVNRPGPPQPLPPGGSPVPSSSTIRDPVSAERLSPYYWAAFTLSGDWR